MRVLDLYVRWLVRHAWLVLALVVVTTVLVASGIRQLRTEFSVEASLPTGHPFVRIDQTIRKEFGGRRTLLVGIVPPTGDVWQPDVLAVVHDFTMAALRLPDVMAQNVVSLAAPSVRHVEDTGGSTRVDYLMREGARQAIAVLQGQWPSNCVNARVTPRFPLAAITAASRAASD